MLDPNRRPDLGGDLADLRRRVEDLERRNQLTRAQADIDGVTVLRVDADGLGAPHQHLPWIDSQTPPQEIISAGTFTAAWETTIPTLIAPHVRFTLLATSAASGAGDVRVTLGSATSDSIAVPALAVDQLLTCDWAHGEPLGGLFVPLKIEARVNSGNSLVFDLPTPAELGKSATATTGGFT